MFRYFRNLFSGNKNLEKANNQFEGNGANQTEDNEKTDKSKAFCNDEGLSVEHTNGTIESALWDEIIKISVITTDQGPYTDDVFIVLFKEEKGVLVPSGAEGYNEVYERVSKFDGFDFQRYIDSMSSTINKEFICWERRKSI